MGEIHGYALIWNNIIFITACTQYFHTGHTVTTDESDVRIIIVSLCKPSDNNFIVSNTCIFILIFKEIKEFIKKHWKGGTGNLYIKVTV